MFPPAAQWQYCVFILLLLSILLMQQTYSKSIQKSLILCISFSLQIHLIEIEHLVSFASLLQLDLYF